MSNCRLFKTQFPFKYSLFHSEYRIRMKKLFNPRFVEPCGLVGPITRANWNIIHEKTCKRTKPIYMAQHKVSYLIFRKASLLDSSSDYISKPSNDNKISVN